MSESFGFDPKTLSDNELFTQQVELMRRKSMVGGLGRGDAVLQLDILIQAIEAERQERMFLERWKQMPDSPVVIESDPGLRARDDALAESQIPKPRQPSRASRRPIRSARPTSET